MIDRKEAMLNGQNKIDAVLNFLNMQQNIARISALTSKMGQIKKVNAHYHPN